MAQSVWFLNRTSTVLYHESRKLFVTWKAKTDTNALPFNEKNCYYPFNIRLKQIV